MAMLSNNLINQYRELRGHSLNRSGTTESLFNIHKMDRSVRKSQTSEPGIQTVQSFRHLAPKNYQSKIKTLSNPEKAKLEIAASLLLSELNQVVELLAVSVTQGLDESSRLEIQDVFKNQLGFAQDLRNALTQLIDNLGKDLQSCKLDLNKLAYPNAAQRVVIGAKPLNKISSLRSFVNLKTRTNGQEDLNPAERLSYWARKSINAQYYNKANDDRSSNKEGLEKAYSALLSKSSQEDNDAELSNWVLNFGAEMALEVLKSTKALQELHERYVTYMLTRPTAEYEQGHVNQASCIDQVNSDSPIPKEQRELEREFVTQFDELNKRVVIFESVKSLISKSGEKFFYRLSPGSALDASIVWNTYDDNCKLAGLIDDGPLSLQDTSSRYEAKLGALCSAHEVTNWARILA